MKFFCGMNYAAGYLCLAYLIVSLPVNDSDRSLSLLALNRMAFLAVSPEPSIIF